MTIGVVTVRTSRAYWREVARINREYERRTGFRPSLTNPQLYTICNRCGRVQAECVCAKHYQQLPAAV
jgi:hypothetical protein